MPIYGVIDVGSNAIKLKIARCEPPNQIEILCDEREPVRMGSGVFRGKAIHKEVIDAAANALKRFRKLFSSHKVEMFRAVATSAMREAPNRIAVQAELAERSGIELEIISGSEEARLIQIGTSLDVGHVTGSVLFVDIGGGSCELSVRERGQLKELCSLALGAVRLTENFIHGDPVSGDDHRKLKDFIYSELRQNIVPLLNRNYELAVGTAGTINAICESILSRRNQYPNSTPNAVSYSDISQFHRRLRESTQDERMRLPGLSSNRADIIVAGAAVLKYVLKTLRLRSLRPSRRGLRDGVLVDLLSRFAHDRSLQLELHKSRMNSLMQFGDRFGVHREHSDHVTRLALSLFDQLRNVHRLTDGDRALLEAAGLLHEVGRAVNYGSMHKHSYYIIRNAELTGFTQDEIEVIANVARYHRRSEPSRRHENFRHLTQAQRHSVQWLAALLRVADGLDRHHDARVRGVKTSLRGGVLRLELDNEYEAELEIWSSRRKSHSLAELLGRKIEYREKKAPEKILGKDGAPLATASR
ncbi:MAG: Ppx/GppA family phosphatase [Planctomycetes bacterium]|nr:Ppx/GppA family phosphatase [Planctomycetota bacterium]